MTFMKPSERIEQIRGEMIDSEYNVAAYRNMSLEAFRGMRRGDPKLMIDAILSYLDEIHQPQERGKA